MTFEAFELSTYEGTPVELYRFQRGSDRWTQTSSNNEYTFQSEVYDPLSISRDKIEETDELERQKLSITVARDNEVAIQYIGIPPSNIMSLTVFRVHRDDTDEDTKVIWKGRVTAVEFMGSEARITCEPIMTSMGRMGLRRKYSTQCPYVLYGGQCGVLSGSFQIGAILTNVTGVILESAAFASQADGWWSGGSVTTADNDKRMIINHTGTQIEIASQIQGLAAGDLLQVLPGCSHNVNDCVNKFNNVVNYGGFPFMPDVNPFGGQALF